MCQECTLPAQEEEEEEDGMGRFTCDMRNLMCDIMRDIKTPAVHVLYCADLLIRNCCSPARWYS